MQMEELTNETQKSAYESCLYSLALGTPLEIMTMIMEEHVIMEEYDTVEGFKWAISDWFFVNSVQDGLGCKLRNHLNMEDDE